MPTSVRIPARLQSQYRAQPAQSQPPDGPTSRQHVPHRHPSICRRRDAGRPIRSLGPGQEISLRPGAQDRLVRPPDGRLAGGAVLRLGRLPGQDRGLRADQAAAVWL